MMSTARSRAARLDGRRLIPRTELSPRPIPQMTLPPVIWLRVANALPTTIGSRVTGFVTQVPHSSRSLLDMPISQPIRLYTSCQMMWESHTQIWSNLARSAARSSDNDFVYGGAPKLTPNFIALPPSYGFYMGPAARFRSGRLR